MTMDRELKGYARDCIRLAYLTDDPTIRGPLLKMAREWLEAAAASYPRRVTRVAKVRSQPLKGATWAAAGLARQKQDGPVMRVALACNAERFS